MGYNIAVNNYEIIITISNRKTVCFYDRITTSFDMDNRVSGKRIIIKYT